MKVTDLQVVGKNQLRIGFDTVQLANVCLNNTTLPDTLDIEVRIAKYLLFKHAVVFSVDLGMAE